MSDIELPDPIPYSKLQSFESIPTLTNLFCYVVKPYNDGVGLTIIRQDGNVCVRIADWDGKLIDAAVGEKDQFIRQIMCELCARLVLTMKLIDIPKALFYFARLDQPRLVDIMFSFTKFSSPGFLSEVFGKAVPVQESVGNPIFMSPEQVSRIKKKEGIYELNKYIIKPSQFKFIVDGTKVSPMYGELSCEAKSTP